MSDYSQLDKKSVDQDDNSEESLSPVTPSSLAQVISELKKAAFRATDERQRLPQPMFWSVFNLRINEIRNKKKLQRFVRETLDGD